MHRACHEQGVTLFSHRLAKAGRKAESILKLVRAERTAPQISERLGVSVDTIRRVCRNHGLRCKPAYLPLSAKTRRIVRALKDPAKTLGAIARTFGVSRQWVQQVYTRALRQGVLRPRPESKAKTPA